MNDYQLPCPKSWDDFESICFDLWKSIWGDPAAHHYGRQGQRQNGVDIYGRGRYDESLIGIQCKGKNRNYGKKLTVKEVNAECNKARKFKHKLGAFIMATTSPRDNKIQDHCLTLNENKEYEFNVDSWSWDDIEEEIQCRSELMVKHYPNYRPRLLNKTNLSRFVPLNKIDAFFSRPDLIPFDNDIAKNHLHDLAYELAINAIHHGKASEVSIKIEEAKIFFIDNGLAFNPNNLLNNNNENGGSTALRHAKQFFSYNYTRNDKENTFEVTYIGNDINSDQDQPYTLVLDIEDIYDRKHLSRYVAEAFENQCYNAQRVIVDIVSYRIHPSGAFGLVDGLIDSINEFQSVVVYLPAGLYYEEELQRRASSTHIRFIKKGWPD